MFESPLFWPAYIKKNVLYVLDETLIPEKLKYIPVKNVKEAVGLIRSMKTRAFGQFLVVLYTFLIEQDKKSGLQHLRDVASALNNSRPTFPFAEVTSIVLSAAQKAQTLGLDGRAAVIRTIEGFLAGIRNRRLQRVHDLSLLMRHGDSILTHCNVSGELAMAAFLAKKHGRHIKIFVTETRPYMQGARLTVWELQKAKITAVLVPDNAVASLMADRLVNKVIIGSDRAAANGDIANKIGSYQMAVLAREFDLPLIVLTQPSQGVLCGEDIPIELRNADELLTFEGRKIFDPGVKGFYPAFDVVPHELITKALAIKAGI